MDKYMMKVGKNRYGKTFTLYYDGQRVASITKNIRHCLPVIKNILSEVTDDKGIPMELHTKLDIDKQLILDETAFSKLHLLFLLQKGVKEINRVKLLALRINRFSREEANYWLSFILHRGEAQRKWAIKGMRIMLCGTPDDTEDVESMLMAQFRWSMGKRMII